MRENKFTSAPMIPPYGIMINVLLVDVVAVDDDNDECVAMLSMRIKILIFLRNSIRL